MGIFMKAFITHTVAFLAGAFVIFALLSLAMSQAMDVNVPSGHFTCFPMDR